MDWQNFVKVKPEVRKVIIEALGEQERLGPTILFYVHEPYVTKTETDSNKDLDDEIPF